MMMTCMLCGINDIACLSYERTRRVVGSEKDDQAGGTAETVIGMEQDQSF